MPTARPCTTCGCGGSTASTRGTTSTAPHRAWSAGTCSTSRATCCSTSRGHDDRWHRRAAITAAFWIIRAGDLDDPLALCEMLAADPEHLVQTNVGVALREIGRVDRARLEEFLARRGDDLSAQRAERDRSVARSSLVS